LGQDYNQDYYYLINPKVNKIDTLVGCPLIFGDKILCQESEYTDGPDFIEIWNLEGNRIQLIDRFSLKPCGKYTIDEMYIREDTLFVRCEHNLYLKLKTKTKQN